MTTTMRAVVLDAPGPPEALHIRELPIPDPRPGWVLIRVKAFGLNRSEMFTRQGHSGAAVTFPRVLGIECVGEVEHPSDSNLRRGQSVAARTWPRSPASRARRRGDQTQCERIVSSSNRL